VFTYQFYERTTRDRLTARDAWWCAYVAAYTARPS